MDKTNIVKFTPTNIVCNPLTIKYVSKVVTEVTNFKFLGLHIDNHLNWRWHIEQILPKLSAACYTIRKFSHVLNIDVLKIVYFTNFHFVVEYGIFWGNSSNIGHVFLLQKKVIRIMVGASSRCWCRSLFRKLEILTLPCLYIYSLMLFVLKNMDNYQTNSSIHTINIRCKNQLHRPVTNLSSFQKGVFYSGLRIFDSLQSIIFECQNNKSHFRAALRKYLVAHCFYTQSKKLITIMMIILYCKL
jgi:hypothetical protein